MKHSHGVRYGNKSIVYAEGSIGRYQTICPNMSGNYELITVLSDGVITIDDELEPHEVEIIQPSLMVSFNKGDRVLWKGSEGFVVKSGIYVSDVQLTNGRGTYTAKNEDITNHG